ncbi:hypothetical protein [Gemella cuniculi]|uniref:hypothetical protein n=1 Tax=Gemella cuniculi TaxID=150240 RepID=UPI0004236D4D|nr:hypothetical protein [Gemella cuniculi]
MKRKTYIIIMLSMTFIMCSLGWIYDNTKYDDIVAAIGYAILAIWFLYTSYLLIVKKSYNLLAGMTEEKAAEIKNNPEEEKIIKTAKIVGYIFIITALVLLVSACFFIR